MLQNYKKLSKLPIFFKNIFVFQNIFIYLHTKTRKYDNKET